MKVLKASFIMLLVFLTGCVHIFPALLSTGAAGLCFYDGKRCDEIYRVEWNVAYKAAIKTLRSFSFNIVDIRTAEHKRILKAKDPSDNSRKIVIELERIGDGRYVRAIFKARKGGLSPDVLYSRILMKEFSNILAEQDRIRAHSVQATKL